MRIDRLAFAAVALVASSVMVGCGSDDNSTPSNDSIGVSGSLPSLNSSTVDSSTGNSTMDTTAGLGSSGANTTTP
jgi:hypothetical protein